MVYYRKNRKKLLNETSKSVRRYVKSGDLEIFWKNFWKIFPLKSAWNAKKFNKILDPPLPLPWHLEYFLIYDFLRFYHVNKP